MFSFDPGSHHVGDDAMKSLWQMGQPTERLPQRQLADNIPQHRADAHGIERELQFADLDYREMQAMG